MGHVPPPPIRRTINPTLEPGMILKLAPDEQIVFSPQRRPYIEGVTFVSEPPFVPWSPPWYEVLIGVIVFIPPWLVWQLWKKIRRNKP